MRRWLATSLAVGTALSAGSAITACFVQPDAASGPACAEGACTDAGGPVAPVGSSTVPPSGGGGATGPVSYACPGVDLALAPSLPDAGGTFFATGVDRRTTFSTDGLHWLTNDYAARDADAGADAAPEGPRGDLVDVVRGDDGLFVAAASKGVMTSTDGLSWLDQALPEVQRYVPYDNGFGAVAYGKGVYVVAARAQFRALAMFSSTDGVTWPTPQLVTPDKIGGSILDIAFADGKFVAVGEGQRTLVSDDGIAWRDDRFGSEDGQRTYRAVAHGNGRWVAVGSQSILGWSTDGVSWTSSSRPDLIGEFGNLLFDGEKFLTCGRVGCFTSPDGETWTALPGLLTDPRPVGRMVQQDGLYVGIDAAATMLTSTDGATWTPVYCGEAPRLQGLVFVPR